MSSHLKLLTSNVAFFGGVAVLGRVLNVIGLPLLAWIIADPSVLGSFDLLITIGSLGAALANFGVNEASQKIYFDNTVRAFKQEVITAMLVAGLLTTTTIVVLALLGVSVAGDHLHLGVNDVISPFIAALLVFILRLRFLFEVPLIVENRKSIIGAVAMLEIVVFYVTAILFVKLFGKNYVTITTARLLSLTFAAIVLCYYSLFPWFNWKFPRQMVKRLLLLGLPLTFSSLLYWGLALSDRVIIGYFLGTAELGTYAVCAKFAAMSELIRTGVVQGMTFFIFSTSKDVGHKRRMYLITSFFLAISTFIFGFTHLLAPVLVESILPVSYSSSSIIIPYLIVGPLLLASFQIVGAEFILVEKPFFLTISQIIGVAVTITVSLSLVSCLGIIGPAIGTLLGYATMFIAVLIAAKQCGEQPFFKQLLLWSFPLTCVVILSLVSYKGIQFVIPFISIISVGCWAYINRKLCLASARSIVGLMRR